MGLRDRLPGGNATDGAQAAAHPAPPAQTPTVPPVPAPGVPAVVPVRWDYRTVVMGHGLMGWHKDEIKRGDLEKQLDSLGREGWELVHVYFDQKLHGEKDGHLMIFKRPVYGAEHVAFQG